MFDKYRNQQATYTAIAIQERVYGFKLRVN